jgi:hypothetical protein
LVLTGRIEDAALADLLRQLIATRETAVVSLATGSLRKAVWVQSGRIVFATSTDPDDRLGECMLRLGSITVRQYEESARQIRPGKRQGTILVEMGACTPDDLVRGVEAQVERIVADMLAWRTGDYRIDLGAFETSDLIQLAVPTEQILFHGIKRSAGWSQVRRGLGNLEMVLARAPDADARLHRLDLDEDDMHAYSLASGRLDVAQCCAMSYASEHETCVTLYGLACCGLLVPVVLSQEQEERRRREAGSELVGIHDRVRSFGQVLAGLCGPLAAALGDRAPDFYDAVLASILDEHHDVLRDVRLSEGLALALIVDNVQPVEEGRRCVVVERALVALERALVVEVGRALGPVAGERVAAAFGAPGRSA